MSWPPPLFLEQPATGWTLDCTKMQVPHHAYASLPWKRVFTEMEALESGEVVNTDEGRQVGHYWLRDPVVAPTMKFAEQIGETRRAVEEFARDILSGAIGSEGGEPFTDVLHVGIGGSSLGPALVVDAVGGEGLSVRFLDNTDPDGIARHLAAVGERLRTTLVVIVSKSGGTPETRNAMLLVRDALQSQGFDVPSHMVAITGPGSILDTLAQKEGWLARFPIWDWVGGRTSLCSAVGLLPAALAGVDTTSLLLGAREMDCWTRHTSWEDNPAALLAGSWYLTGDGNGERNMVILPYSDRLVLFSRHLQQLIMESLGKRYDRQGAEVLQGLTVYGNKGSTDQHAYVQQLRDGRNDFFATFVQVLEDGAGSSMLVDGQANTGDFLQGFLLGTRRALTEMDRPSLTITVNRIDAATLGGLIALFERSVSFYATMVDINAYHQPGVEAGKKAARDILALSSRIREALPATLDELVELLGADRLEIFYILQRLQRTGRASVHNGRWKRE